MGEYLLRSSSYTLLELLVTASIISIMASTIGSAAVRVRAKAEDVLCRNNLRQLGQGIELYACIYNDSMPPADFGGYIDSWLNFFHADMLPETDLYACPRQSPQETFAPYGGNIFPYNQLHHASYLLNNIARGQWNGAALSTNPNHSSGWGNGTCWPIRLSSARRPADTIMLTDALSGLSSADARGIVRFDETDKGQLGDERDVGIHHDGGGFMTLYGDGHVGCLWNSFADQWVALERK